ncbi:regulator of protease activity HflC (stomatin/prohibitin superfamily) [Azotobacter chroococcum]|uniref:Regulator of protease activity HflC (Stomatin/prohibitin superfamily) n=2 Tax=Azotobacter chroococcum TaxID=353 RepID=A0A4R1PLN7_9GAMM|nr:regulator of protease activity HflC (stomatin/prohibitin superfamily) [Azotobacter chroococcum]
MEWWHWVVGGIVLILLELAIPAFFVIWFGLGALLVAGVLLLAGALSLTAQLLVWTLSSLAMTALWFGVFRPGRQTTRIGTAAGETIGEVGLLVSAVAPFERGRVRFQKPILGAEEWPRPRFPRGSGCGWCRSRAATSRWPGLDLSERNKEQPMSAGLAVAIAVLAFALITIAKGVRLVAQGEEWVVERLGRYHVTLRPGLNIIIPFLDNVAYKLVTKDIILDVQQQEVITRDNAVILANAIAFVKVTDPVKAVYGVTDFSEAIRNLIMTTLRSIVGEMELDEALSSRDKIKARLRESIADEAVDWGLTVKSVEIQDIKPSESMQRAMELQAAAERERKAAVTKAEGEKQAAILEAEARLEAARRDANAQVLLAEASSESIRRVTSAVGSEPGPMMYLLGEKYIASVEKLAQSDNAKVVLMPADLQETLRGLVGKLGGRG